MKNIVWKEMPRQDVWRRLHEASLVEGDMPPAREQHSPWFVRVMLGVAGWIGALFLFGFVGVAFSFVMNNAAASLVLGVLCCTGAYMMFRAAKANDFAMQFGLAVSLAGQALIAVGTFKAFAYENALAYLIICLIEAMLAAVMPNFIHRVLSTWGALVALSFALERIGVPMLAPAASAATFALVWLNDVRWSVDDATWRPIGYGATLGLLQIDAQSMFERIFWLHGAADTGWLASHAAMVSALLVGSVFLLSVVRLLDEQRLSPSSRSGIAALGAVVVLTAISCAAPGIATALLVLLVGFSRGNRILVGIGLLALGGFLSHYYYQLQTTLLNKSMVLATSGFALLATRAAMQKWFGNTDAGDANG